MQTASHYRRRADECRLLASTMDAAASERMLHTADDWAELAKKRIALILANPWMAEPGELEEDTLRLCAGGMHCGVVPRQGNGLPSQVCLRRCLV
jgi:hypothetical protein